MQHVDGRSVVDKTSIAVSIDKRVNLQIPMPPLAVTLPQQDGNLQSSYLPNGLTFGINGTAVVGDKNNGAFNRTHLLPTVQLPSSQSMKVILLGALMKLCHSIRSNFEIWSDSVSFVCAGVEYIKLTANSMR